jgi:3-oxoadipate enol-lactonase
MTGIGLALAAPQRLATLTLVDCRADAPEAFKRQWDERCGTARQHGMAPLVDGTLARWFTPRFHERHPETVARIGAMIRATKPAGYIACANAIKSLAYKPRLGEVRTPTLLLCGRSDEPLPGAMRAMAEAIPGSRYVEIDDAAHIPNIEQPDAFLAPLGAFLASGRH